MLVTIVDLAVGWSKKCICRSRPEVSRNGFELWIEGLRGFRVEGFRVEGFEGSGV